MYNSKDLGDLAQVKFMHDAIKNNLKVSSPYGDNLRYDFIVDNGYRLFKIQVKSTSNYIEKKNCYQISTSFGSSKKELYTHKDIDFFACFVAPVELWYIIPVFIVTTPTIRIYQDSNVSKFSHFKEAWHMLH